MFNAEKLLGTVLSQVMGSGSSRKKKGKNSLLGSLASGGGLMTAIGLGIGAYEILKEKKQSQPAPPGYPAQPPSPPSAPAWGGSTMPPPPPPVSTSHPNSPPVAADPAPQMDSQELAIRMIRVMIAAAHADGNIDEEEEKAILARLRSTDLSQEERMFILDELHQPKTIAELTAGISDPSIAKTMYMLAVSAIAIDSPGERAWLDKLAASLAISKAVQAFIEEQR
ncbi:MAG: tellurite resistance TerB family protein [Proteobacteria bacterium]|nr:tellurite resistance TerB family protein [Pseudomonadota bacterium]